MEYLFRFSDKFVIHDDFTVLKKIGMTMGKFGFCVQKVDIFIEMKRNGIF